MVFVKLDAESHSDIIGKLKIDLSAHKFQLVPQKTLQASVDQYNKSQKQQQEKLYLSSIVKPEMIYMQADLEALERDQANNDPKLVKERLEREARIQENRYQGMLKKDKFKQQSSMGADIREMEKSISFGVSFIFTFFLSGISGYYVGKYFFGLNEGLCMVLAVVALIATLILESVLFILKTWKNDKIMAERETQDKVKRQNMRNSESQELTKLILEFQQNKQKPATEKKND